MNYGILGSGTYYFNRHVGVQMEIGAHDLWTNSSSSNGGALTAPAAWLPGFLPTESLPSFTAWWAERV